MDILWKKMADRVIIADTKRGQSLIPANEIMQMAGRCGRREGEGGNVNIIVSKNDVDQIRSDLKNNSELSVNSTFDNDSVVFHITSEIVNGNINFINDVDKWFERSFACILGYKINSKKVLKEMYEFGIIEIIDDKITPTKYAELSNIYYFHPYDIYYWKKNFTELFERELEKDNSVISWALTNIYTSKNEREVSDYYHYIQQYKDELSSIGMKTEGILSGLVYWSILNGIGLGKIRNTVRAYQLDFERMKKILCELFPDKKEYFEELSLRIRFKAGDEILPLLKIKNISKNLALEMYNMGIEYPEDIEDNIDSIQMYGSEKLKEFVGKMYDY